MDTLYRWSPVFLSILRIVVGLLFLEHGTQKLFGFPPSGRPPGEPPTTLDIVGAWLEFGGGILIVLGLFTRFVAFILSGMMAVAYFKVHAAMGFYPIVNRGELAIIYCFVFLYMAVAGGGAWSIDSLWKREAANDRP